MHAHVDGSIVGGHAVGFVAVSQELVALCKLFCQFFFVCGFRVFSFDFEANCL